jgi:hypothetical protein
MTLVKSAPEKSFAQKADFLGLFLSALFTKVICIFLKTVRKDKFFDVPFDLFKEKKFSSLNETMNLFEELKRSKMEKTAQYFEKQFFTNRS